MFTAFSTALSGMNAMTTAIDVVGNNLANLNTDGFKNRTVSFQDLVAESLSGNSSSQVGLGTGVPTTTAQFLQGNVTTTGGSFDGAINGSGFFVVKDTSGQTLYTRAGNFLLDKNGYLTSQSGERVQGWKPTNGAINPSGALSDIQVPTGQTLAGEQSTAFSGTINLDASTAASGTWSTSAITAYDSLGNQVPLNINFVKDPATAGKWNYTVTSANATVTGNTGSLQFDTSGNLAATTVNGVDANGNPITTTVTNGAVPLSFSNMSDGAANMTVNWDVSGSAGVPNVTQYSTASSLTAQTQDGQAAAVLTGVSLQNDGKITASYSNGAKQQVVAQLALASVRNPQSLLDVGNNNFSLGSDSASPVIGAAGTGGLGAVDGGAVESSTVDIASEFSQLLTFQRSYQADSRVVTVSDELAQDAVGLIK